MARKKVFTTDTAYRDAGVLGTMSPIASGDPQTILGVAYGTQSTQPPDDVIHIVDDE